MPYDDSPWRQYMGDPPRPGAARQVSGPLYVDPAARKPEPGDIFVCDVGGLGGVAIAAGQVLDGDPARWLAWTLGGRKLAGGVFPPAWSYEHAGIYIGGMQVVQAEPGGTQLRTIRTFQFTRRVIWSTGAFPALTASQRGIIVDAARGCAQRKVPYSIDDYIEIAERRIGLSTGRLRHEIASSGHMICSQECDWCYQQAQCKIFDDERWNGDVKPSDLAQVFIDRGVALRNRSHP